MLVDSHVHIDMLKDPQSELTAAYDAGVRRVLAVGIDLESSNAAAKLPETYSWISASVGIHPHEASSAGDEEIRQLEGLASRPGVVAIGETGLDFYRNRSPRGEQERAFREHIELARRTGLTLVVHSRDAADETLRILRERAAGLTVVLHCFSMPDRVEECATEGYYMSMAGNVTFKNASELRTAAAAIPSHLLLVETDSPFLSPAPRRGKPNSPGNIPLIMETLASLRGVSMDNLALQVEANFLRAFALNNN